MRAASALVVLVIALVLALVTACGGAGSAPGEARSDSLAASPRVLPLSSLERQAAGRPVVYLFTAPGCESCAAEARALATAAQGHPQVQLVGVDLSNDSPAAFASYVAAVGLADGPFAWTIDQDGSLARRFGIASLSSTVMIDAGGRVRFINHGGRDAPTLSAQLGQLG